jgi:hypothetical protein
MKLISVGEIAPPPSPGPPLETTGGWRGGGAFASLERAPVATRNGEPRTWPALGASFAGESVDANSRERRFTVPAPSGAPLAPLAGDAGTTSLAGGPACDLVPPLETSALGATLIGLAQGAPSGAWGSLSDGGVRSPSVRRACLRGDSALWAGADEFRWTASTNSCRGGRPLKAALASSSCAVSCASWRCSCACAAMAASSFVAMFSACNWYIRAAAASASAWALASSRSWTSAACADFHCVMKLRLRVNLVNGPNAPTLASPVEPALTCPTWASPAREALSAFIAPHWRP